MSEPGLFDSTDGLGEPDPTHLHIWGVDVASARISVGIEGPGMPQVFSQAFDLARGRDLGERLMNVHRGAYLFAESLARRWPPEQVSVESPAMVGAQGSEPVLQYATGAVVAAFARALQVPIWMVPVMRWKKRATGSGKAEKADVMRWAHAHGVDPKSQDEADAAGVARAARVTCWEGQGDEKDVARGAVLRRVESDPRRVQ